METSKEQMSKYLEKMQYLQRVCLGHAVKVESHNIDDMVFLDFSAIWEKDTDDMRCEFFTVREWDDKEYNDRIMKECVEFLTNTLNWI